MIETVRHSLSSWADNKSDSASCHVGSLVPARRLPGHSRPRHRALIQSWLPPTPMSRRKPLIVRQPLKQNRRTSNRKLHRTFQKHLETKLNQISCQGPNQPPTSHKPNEATCRGTTARIIVTLGYHLQSHIHGPKNLLNQVLLRRSRNSVLLLRAKWTPGSHSRMAKEALGGGPSTSVRNVNTSPNVTH